MLDIIIEDNHHGEKFVRVNGDIEFSESGMKNIRDSIVSFENTLSPSTVDFLLHSPYFDRRRLSLRELDILKKRYGEIRYSYRQVLGGLGALVNDLSSEKSKFNLSLLRRTEPDIFREKILRFYQQFGDFKLDKTTSNALYLKGGVCNKNPENVFRSRFIKDSGIIDTFRFKSPKSSTGKHKIVLETELVRHKLAERFDSNKNSTSEIESIVSESIPEIKNDFLNGKLPEMIEMVITSPEDSVFSYDFREQLKETYDDRIITKFWLRDLVGYKRIDFNEERYEYDTSKIIAMVRSTDENKPIYLANRRYRVSKGSFDDHTGRKGKESKPGGIHLLVSPSGRSDFPIEIQFLDGESAILDLFGPKAHGIYSCKKKDIPLYVL